MTVTRNSNAPEGVQSRRGATSSSVWQERYSFKGFAYVFYQMCR